MAARARAEVEALPPGLREGASYPVAYSARLA
jgi:hypothetical protein